MTQPVDPLDDPDVPDERLTPAQRQQIRDIAQQLIDGTLRMDADTFFSLPRAIQRKAWNRYQARFEDNEKVRERNTADFVDRDNRRARRGWAAR